MACCPDHKAICSKSKQLTIQAFDRRVRAGVVDDERPGIDELTHGSVGTELGESHAIGETMSR